MRKEGKRVRVRYLAVKRGQEVHIDCFPNFHRSGSISGMKRQFYGNGALLVRCGQWIYNVSDKPSIYDAAR